VKEPRRVLIAGCGYVGIALGERLLRDGVQAIGMRRNVGALPEALDGVSADLTDVTSFSAIPAKITDVVITASPGGGDDASYVTAYVRGPEDLLAFLAERGDPVARVLLTTSTGVYAQTDGSWVDETSKAEPTHHSGKRMLEGEALIAACDVISTAVRLGGIYGPGRTRLVDRVRNGEARTPKDPLWTNRIHRDDCAGMLRHLLLCDDPPPRVVGVDTEPADLADVQRFLASELGVTDPPLEEPRDPAATGRRARSNKRCSSALAIGLGYSFAFPTYREGYRAMLASA